MIRRLTTLATGAVLFAGCSLPLWLMPEPPEYTELSTEDAVGFRDAGAPRSDSSPDREIIDASYVCDWPASASDVTCPTKSTARPRTVCTDDALTELLTCVGTKPDDATRCLAAKKAYPECNACIFTEWLIEGFPDSAACMRAIAPESPCADGWRCQHDCLVAVCLGCETELEWTGCSARAVAADGGACWSRSKDYVGCAEQPRFAPCLVNAPSELRTFFRGACVTGGLWSLAVDASTD